jgi:S1-C subfamily serine protease
MRRLNVVLLTVIVLSAGAAAARKPWLGMALVLKGASDGGKFLYVAHAPENAPAYISGIRPGDLIVRIDGKKIQFRDDLDIIEFTSSLTPEKNLKLRIVRAGKEQDLRVRVGVLPVDYEELLEQSLRKAREARARAKH